MITKYEPRKPAWTSKTDVFGHKIAVFSGIYISNEAFFMSDELEGIDGFLLYQCRLLNNHYSWPASMRCLYLMHTRATSDQLRDMAEAHNLKYFKAFDTSLDSQSMMELANSRPDIQIMLDLNDSRPGNTRISSSGGEHIKK